MRFSLQDVKRQIRRRDGKLTVSLHFLRPDELRAEIERLVAYYEQQRDQPHKNFAQDEASSLVGDYRMASCLQATLSTWYNWRQPLWADVLNDLSSLACTALEDAEIRSPAALRLALFDYVNAHHSGFLDAQVRVSALATFAHLYHLDPDRLDYLLALDTNDETILTRTTTTPPDADTVARLYNQWVFEAALFNASEVCFIIDCEAFLESQRANTRLTVTGIGGVIKRLCYLARKLGVYYDLAYEDTLPDARLTLLRLTLYGPQEMTGSPQQYGQRLGRLCRLLLGYGTSSSSASARTRQQSSLALAKAIRQAEATVHIFQQAYNFQMETGLLSLLPPPESANNVSRETNRQTEATTIYDSGVEQSLAEAFAALERGNGVDGWKLEREPEPLLLSANAEDTTSRGIFIPDFALTRGKKHIYMEILGYWTPAYRERKVQKLQLLRGRTDLILALPLEARASFASLRADFPMIEYRDQLSATELLRVLHTRYDDFEERLTNLDNTHIQTLIRSAHFIPERACYELLHCYRRSELPRATARILAPDMGYTSGLGLYLLDWLEHIHMSFVEWIEANGHYKFSLSDIIQKWQPSWPELITCDENAIETLLGLWPEVQIQHASIFETLLVVEANREREITPVPSHEEAEPTISIPGKAVRERRTGNRKRPQQEIGQQDLWE